MQIRSRRPNGEKSKIFYRLLSGILIGAYLFSNVLPGVAFAIQDQTSDPQPQSIKGEPKRGTNPETGRTSFIGGGDPIAVPGISAAGMQPEDHAMGWATIYGSEFGLQDPAQELQLLKSQNDGNGQELTHFQQVYHNIPVIAGEMIVNTNVDGELLSISGEVSSALSLNTNPTVNAQNARGTALDGIARIHQMHDSDLISTEPGLWIFDESLLTGGTRPAELVWRMDVTAKDATLPIREMVLVNAHTGEVSFHVNQVDTAHSMEKQVSQSFPENREAIPLSTVSQIQYADLIVDEVRGRLYGADKIGNKIDVIDIVDLSITDSYILTPGAIPTGIDLSGDGSELAVAQSGLNRLAFINLVDGTISNQYSILSGSNTKATDVLYGRSGILYALSNNGIHVFNLNAIPHTEETTQYLSVDGSSNGQKFGELSSDQKTLYYVTGIPSTASNVLGKVDVSEGLAKPTILKKASLYATSMMVNLRLSLIDDGTLLISTGSVYNTTDLTPKARNGQILTPVTAVPGRDYYVTAYNNSIELDKLYFFDKESSYMISMLDVGNGAPGAMAAASDGSRLFISSTGGMTSIDLGADAPGIPVPLPDSLRQYHDFVFDLPRNLVYGTDTSNRIDVIDRDTGSVLNSYLLPNGAEPIGIDLSPDGNEIAVALKGLEKILFIHPESGMKIAEVTPRVTASAYYTNLPFDVIYGRPGRLYAAGHPSSYGDDYLHVIDAVNHLWLARSSSFLDISDDLAITSDQRFLYANEFSSSDNLHTFNVQTDTLTEVSEDAISAEKFATTLSGSKVFTLAGSVWDMATKENLGTLEGAPGNLIEYIPGQNAVVLATQDGNSSVLKFISDTNYHVLASYRPEQTGTMLEMAIAPDGSTLIASFSDGGLLLLDISTLLPVPPSPPPSLLPTRYSDLVIDEARGKLYGADQAGHKIDVIDMSSTQVVQAYFLVNGSSPTGLDLSPDGNTLAVAQSSLQRVAFIDLTDGTVSDLPTPLSGSNIKVTDVLYGRPGILYAFSNKGLHVIDTSVAPPAEKTTQYVSLSSSLERFGALSSDKNTLYYITSASSAFSNLAKFDVSAGLTKPVKITETYLNKSEGLKNIRLGLIDDNTLFTSLGSVYRTSDLQPQASNGQILASVTALPGRNFYVTVFDNPSDADVLNFFDLQSSYKLSMLSTNISGVPGAIAVTSDGNTLFVSSTGGMAKFAIGAAPLGTSVSLPQSLGQYRDFVFDLPRGVIYGTDASNRIDVIERSTGNLLNSYLLANGSDPIGIDLSPDGTELAVALNGLEAILLLDPSTGTEIARVTPQLSKSPHYANQPYDVIYGQAGRLYSDGNSGTDRIHAFDTTTHTWLAKSAVPNDIGAELSLTADKKYLYATDGYYPNNVSGFDVQTDELKQVFRTPHGPALAKKIAISPDGTRIFTSDGQIWSRDLKDQIGALEGAPGELIKYVPGKNVIALTVGNTIKFISAIDYELISTYAFGDPRQLQEMEISPDGAWLILNFSGGGIRILEIASILLKSPVEPLPASIKYEELLVDQTRGRLYGADKVANKIDIISITDLSVIGSFSLAYGSLPTGLDLSADGNTLAVAQSGSNRVLFINVVDGTMVESPALQNSRYESKVYDVLYGRPGLLYALTASGLHVLNTSLHPPVEDVTQFVVVDEDSVKFGAITSDKNTLFTGEDSGNTGHDYVHQFDISAGLAKPVEITYTSFYNPGYVTQLSVGDNNTLVTSWGSTYDASMLMLKAKHGQSPVPVMTIPGHNFYAVAYNNADTSPDDIYFFDTQSSHKLSLLSTGRLGSPGAMATAGDGSTLFVSSSGGMTKHQIGTTPPGTPTDLPQRVGQYRDFVFDLARGVIYGTDASGRVDVLDQNTGNVIKSYLLSNGANPMGIDLSPDGRELAVALGGLEAILFMNPETGAEIARVTPKLAFATYYFNWPYDVIYGRDGRLYSDGNTVNLGTNDYIHVYDTTTHTWLGTGNKLVRYASEMSLTADKKYLYVADTNFSTNNFHVFDVQTDVPTRLYVGTAASQKFTIAPDGSKLFYSSGQIWSGTLQQQLGVLPGSGTLIKYVPGQDALALATSNAIRFISASDYRLLSNYYVPYAGNVIEMEIAPDGSKLIANYPGGKIFILDFVTFPPPTPIPTSTPTRMPSSTPGPGPSRTPGPTSTSGPSPTAVPSSSTGNRRTYTTDGGSALPGTFLCDQSQSPCTNGVDADADAAHQFAADTFVFYNLHHKRNSFDNHGGTIISTVNYGVGYQNAFWNGYQMVYGDNMAADDVVGHEITHGVTQYTSNLIYSYQSGAINESLSDVWGEFIDQTNGSMDDIAFVRWLIGDGSALGVVRSMSNPPAYGHPDKMSSPYYYMGSADNGGVHTNSGVNNKAVYLMVDGGTFNSYTITGIGLEKTAAVYYEVQTNLLTAGSNYNDLYYALLQGCQNLIGGDDGITANDCEQVRLAAEAVEMIPAFYTISGNAGVGGATLRYTENDILKTVQSNSNGAYTITVKKGWTGTVTPAMLGVVFAPANTSYTELMANQTAQNYSASIRVMNTNDSGQGSLRQAIAAALPGSTIRFDSSLAGQTILLSSQLDINKNLSVDGSGLSSPVSISGDHASRIFSIGSNYTVALSSMVLKDGWMSGTVYTVSGGAIYTDANAKLTVTNVDFIGNQASQGGALYVSSTADVTVLNSRFSQNVVDYSGGAIYAANDLSILASEFTNNTAGYGGGAAYLSSSSSYVLENNTFTGNRASNGGAIMIYQNQYLNATIKKNLFSGNVATLSTRGGGAIDILYLGPTIYIENNTFYANQTTGFGGAILAESSIDVRNNTFSENQASTSGNAGASLYYSASAKLYNNIFANNKGGGECSGLAILPVGTNNLVEDASPACKPTIIGDPLLGPLTDNGGPTYTMALLPNSPAIDAGDDANCTAVDQRGVIRPQGSHCDIGAYEHGAMPSTPTNTPTITSTSTPTPTQTSTLSPTTTLTRTPTPGSVAKPGVPGLLSPAKGTVVSTTQPVLDWKDSSPAAHHYQVEVSTNSAFTALVLDDSNVMVSTFMPSFGLIPGKLHYWRVRAFNVNGVASSWSSVRNFKTPLTQPELLAPSNGEVLSIDRPVFLWNVVDGEVQYVLQISASSSFNTLLVNATVHGTEYLMSKDLPQNKTLYWRVRAKSSTVTGPWSAKWTFKTGNPPTVPVLAAPANGSLVKDYTPRLNWSDSKAPSGTTFEHYEVQVDDQNDFSSPVVESTSTISEFTPLAELASNTKFYWRVRAVNTVGAEEHTSGWSPVWMFRTVILSPQALTIIPNDLSALQPNFSWQAATGVITGYTIQVSTTSNFSTLLVNSTTQNAFYSMLKNLPSGKTVYWRVRANGVNGPSAWTVKQFTTP